jgi:hypothetical protein
MAESIKERILKNLVDTLNGVQSLLSADLGSYEPTKEQRPAAGVLPENEDTEHHPDNNHLETFDVAIRVVVDESGEAAGWQLEKVLADVHRAVLKDQTRSGLAERTRKLGTRYLFLDQNYPRAGADFRIQIEFQTEAGDPSVGNINSL